MLKDLNLEQVDLLKEFIYKSIELISLFGLKFLTSIFILIFGGFLIIQIKKITLKLLQKRDFDKAISTFTVSLLNALMWILIIIVALSQLGVQTTSFIAIIGAAGLAIGLALQGSLSNFASGFLIILFRPFKVGDAVEVCETIGIIDGINMLQTTLLTYDNRKVIIPNSQILNGIIINITSEPIRRVDFSFKVGLNSDIEVIKKILYNTVSNHPLVLSESEKPRFIKLSAINRDTLDFVVRVWCLTPNYWTVYFEITENVKIEFEKNNIILPLPQMEVKVNKEN